MSGPQWQIRQAGDRCVVFEFGSTIESSLVNRVIALNAAIEAAVQAKQIAGIVETVPTFRSLSLIYDPLLTSTSTVIDAVSQLDCTAAGETSQQSRHWNIPVHYGGEHGPDLDQVAQLTSLSTEEVISLHQGAVVKVYMLGFQPGFAFLGDTAPRLHLPRRAEPRVRVPAGSVAIAKQLTGIYPWDSPGGWHILGNCPVPFFDARLDPPALLRAGDTVSFRAISPDQHAELLAAVNAAQFERSILETFDSQI